MAPANDVPELGQVVTGMLLPKVDEANGASLPSPVTPAPTEKAVPGVPAWTPRRKLRVVTIGAGFSGLILEYKFQHQCPEFSELVDHTIYESREDIGGTWLIQRYPGVQCDVPAHVYAFPFDPKPDWPKFYASGEEIHQYMKDTTKKWNLDRDVKLKHRVVETIWQEESATWKITVQNEQGTFEETADILISGQGILDKWRWPKIDGLDTFKGHKCHSAAWDHEYDYSGKTVAVIGNGSSGVQIIPKLAALPNTQVVACQRTPNWVYVPTGIRNALGRDDTGNPPYTEEQIRRFREDKEYHRSYRRKMIHSFNAAFVSFLKDSPAQVTATESATKQMRERLKQDPDLCEMLIPRWGLGCRRITPADGYLESLLQPNVQVVNSSIVSASEDSITTLDGRTFKVDVLVCATGFDVTLKPRWRIIGRNGVDLAKEWEADPESYLSVAARDMPNFFTILGPNAVIAHGSLVEAINWSTDYLLKWIRKVATEDIKSFVPKGQAIDEFIQYSDLLHKRLIWTDGCTSWFKRNTVHGRVTAAFAGSALLFRQLISEIRTEDFEIEYRSSNRWGFLGNGFIKMELDPANDLSWYIEN